LSKPVIAIDGPAGAGKSTVAKALARELDLRYLDTGAMYRALGLKALRAGISSEQGDPIASLGATTDIAFAPGDPQRVLLDGADVTDAIRTPEIADMASRISAHSPVRRLLVERQRAMVASGGVVLEGRDATTVVAPNADLRVYLTASLEERAHRRFLEQQAKGDEESFTNVRRDVAQRDHRDITRDDSPLTVAEGVHVIESGGLTVKEVVVRIAALLG